MKFTPLRIVIVLALLGAAFVFRAQIGAKWEEAKGAGAKLSTWMEMKKIADQMDIYTNDQGRPPPENFPMWIDRRMPPEEKNGEVRRFSVDRYGSQYRLSQDRQRGLLIISCGPDTICPSEDDIEVEVDG